LAVFFALDLIHLKKGYQLNKIIFFYSHFFKPNLLNTTPIIENFARQQRIVISKIIKKRTGNA